MATRPARLAYRRLARQFHPDVSPHQDAARRMQELNWAYGMLRDPGDPTNPGYRFMGGTADRAIVGSLVAVGAMVGTLAGWIRRAQRLVRASP